MTKPRLYEIEGGDGLMLHVRDFGPEDAQPILFLHGWSQHHLCWAKQAGSDLAEQHRLICPDLRGHGASGKPLEAGAYTDGALWAADVAAIIDALGLVRPILVGWSMAGWVVGDYLRVHGDSALGGIMLVAALSRGGSHADAEIAAKIRPDATGAALLSSDQGRQLDGLLAFLKASFAAPPSKRDMGMIAGWTMLTPVEVRRATIQRDVDFRPDFATTTCPIALLYGEADRVVPQPTATEIVTQRPDAKLFAYPGTGHMPFWERAEAFNADLATFARECAE
ncbi:MAG: alpha/beta hydrolase [Pseudomonadota bacterium]